MYERSYGYKYAEGGRLDTAAIAKLIRADIKQALKEGMLPDRWKYSVRIERFSGGSSIDVRVKTCADAWTQCDGRNGNASCRNAWCKAGGIYMDSPHATYHDVLSAEGEAARITLERIHNAYNHDGSESMVDYFDVNYYGSVGFER